MKKKILSLLSLLVFCQSAMAQISGSFQPSVDMFGNSFWYFQGQNTSSKSLNIQVECIRGNQKKQFTVNSLYAGNTFTISPSNGWTWQMGDRITVRLPNGDNKTWTLGGNNSNTPGRSKQSNQTNSSVVMCPMCLSAGCSSCGGSGYVVVTSTGVYPYSGGTTTDNNRNNNNNNLVTAEKIRQLEAKRNRAQQDLQRYQESYNRNPTLTGASLVREQQNLISTYQNEINRLKRGY